MIPRDDQGDEIPASQVWSTADAYDWQTRPGPCTCGECWLCTWAAGGDPFGVAEPTGAELREEALDRGDDERAERYE